MIRVFRGTPFLQGVMEKLIVRGFHILEFVAVPPPIYPSPFHLVVAAPEREAGPMAQAPDVLNHLCTDILKKLGIAKRVDTARKDELLPDEQAVAVAEVVKGI